jgi:CrcB protein
MTDWLIGTLLVACGGGLGGMARFWVSGVVARRFGETFPWGTMAVNVTGAAIIGVLGALLLTPEEHAVRHAPLWAGFVVGLLGSYTTVSSFSLQTLALARNGEAGRAAFNIILSLTLCLSAAGATYAATTIAMGAWR